MRAYLEHTRRLPVALVLAVPLLLLYQAGLLAVGFDALNGADVFTVTLMERLGHRGYLIVNGVVVLGFLGGAWALNRKRQFHPRWFLPLVGECALYAATMGTAILFVMDKAHLLGPGEAIAKMSLATRIVISAGAGLHEELVFRLALIPGMALAFARMLGSKRDDAVLPVSLAVVASSVLFSLAHFLAEPFTWFAFWYRGLAGLVFAALFAARGFAVAAYTHFLYDVYVLVLAR